MGKNDPALKSSSNKLEIPANSLIPAFKLLENACLEKIPNHNDKFNEFAPQVIELMSQGKYIMEITVELNIARDTINGWLQIPKNNPDCNKKYIIFSDMFSRAKQLFKEHKIESVAKEVDLMDNNNFKVIQAKTNSFDKIMKLLYPELRDKHQVNVQVVQKFTNW